MEAFIYTIIDMSVISIYCILVIVVLRFFLKKVPKTFSYMLWAVVFLRLILPIFPEAPISLVPQALSVTNSATLLEKPETAFQVDAVVPDTAKIEPIEGLTANTAHVANSDKTVSIETRTKAISENTKSAAASVNQTNVSTGAILFNVWAGGFCVIGTFNLISYLLLRRKTRHAIVFRDYRISNQINSPFVIGIFRPKIYLPDGLSPNEQEYVLQHEKTHIQRFDYLIKLSAFLIVSIHWFNPFAWLAFALMNRDMEMSCDEAVIRSRGTTVRKEYSTTLLAMATGRNLLRPAPLAFGEGNIKMRIKNVLSYKKPTMWIIIVSVLIVAGISIGLFMNPMQSVAAKNTDRQPDQTDYIEGEDPIATDMSTFPSDVPPANQGEDQMATDMSTFPSDVPPANLYELDDFTRDKLIRQYTGMDVVDLSDYSDQIIEAGYTITEPGEEKNSVTKATDADQKSSIVCTQFEDAEDAYRAMDAYILDLYDKYSGSKDEWTVENGCKQPCIYGFEKALFAYDINDMYNDNSVHLACLSGNNLIEAVIPIDSEYSGYLEVNSYTEGIVPMKLDRMIVFLHFIEDLGFGSPVKDEMYFGESLTKIPSEVKVPTKDEFLEIMTAELYSLIDSSDNQINMTDTEQKISVRFNNLSDSELNTLSSMNAMRMFLPCCSEYSETDSYQAFYMEDTEGIEVWIQQENRLIQIRAIWLGSPEDTDKQDLRLRFDALIKKLCYA